MFLIAGFCYLLATKGGNYEEGWLSCFILFYCLHNLLPGNAGGDFVLLKQCGVFLSLLVFLFFDQASWGRSQIPSHPHLLLCHCVICIPIEFFVEFKLEHSVSLLCLAVGREGLSDYQYQYTFFPFIILCHGGVDFLGVLPEFPPGSAASSQNPKTCM